MRNLSEHLSYRLRVSVIMVFFAAIPFTLFSIFYLKSERVKWETSALSEYYRILAVSSEQLSSSIQEMKLKSSYVSNNVNIRNALTEINEMSLAEGLDFVNTLREMVGSVTADNSNLIIRWYPYLSTRDYGEYCYTLDKFRQEFTEGEESLEQILHLRKGEVLVVLRQISRKTNNIGPSEEYICVYSKTNNLSGSNCLLEMCMPIEKILNIEDMKLEEDSVLGACLLLEQPHIILLSSGNEDAEALLKQYCESGTCPGYYPVINQMSYMEGSQVICLLSEKIVEESIQTNMIKFSILIGMFILSILVCSYMASTMLTNRITRFLERVNDELDTILEMPSVKAIENRDFLGIELKLRDLIKNTQEYCARLEQYAAENNRMELELLQMRFNPHFLYNTLGSIRHQVKDETIQSSIDSLIRYYRIVLNKGHLLISIEDEIAMIHEYLKVETFAYCLQYVNYVFDIDEKVKKYMIIKHLLQPLVENALEHGIRANKGKGSICIRARLEGQDIVFEIEDNGRGMTQEQIESALSEPSPGNIGGGYGVYNVQQRVVTYYGAGYGITFQSKPGEGTCAMLRIPQR